MEGLCVESVDHGSPLYWEAVELRTQILRKPLGLQFSPEELAAESDSVHLVLLKEDKVVACLVLVPKTELEIKMRQVAVDSAFQRRGLGQAMVEASEDLARKRGFKLVTLHARQTAVPFYRRLGYETRGPEFIEVGVPHQLMTKPLP